MDQFCGKYKFVSSDKNFEDFLTACGVSLMMRKAGSLSKPVIEIKKDSDDGTYSLKTVTTFKTSEIKFKLGEEFEQTRLDGTLCKSVINLEDNKMTEVQKAEDKEIKIVREFEGDELKTICSVDDIVCTRVYKKSE